jgi:hypothetical protein
LAFREVAADESLGGEDRIEGIGYGLPLGNLTNEFVSVLGEADDGGGRAATFFIGDYLGLPGLHDCHY